MKKTILIIAVLMAMGLSSCTVKDSAPVRPVPTAQTQYVLEYTKGVTILRRVEG